MLYRLTTTISSIINRIKWKANNRHNETYLLNSNVLNNVKVGKYTYGPIDVVISSKESFLNIGSYCSIAENTKFILGADHYLNHISTFPFKVKCMHSCKYEAISKGDIVIDDDVWVGYGAIILSGVHIEQGAVIAAGAVVTKDVPAYAIVAGVPAKVIKYRFSQDIIDEMLKIDYSNLSEEAIKMNINKLYTEMSDKKLIEWMPMKHD